MVLIRSVSGVRGLVGEDLTLALVTDYAQAFGTMVGGRVVVGWDARRGGAELHNAVLRGLEISGAVPHDIGVVPTPTVGIAVRRGGFSGGMVVTASHNPEEYNGLKFFAARGTFLERPDVVRLLAAVDARLRSGIPDADPPQVESAQVEAMQDGSMRGTGEVDWIERHLDLILNSGLISLEAVRSSRPRIVVDCVNAAGSFALPELLRRIGCDVIELNTKAGAGFPHGAEPVPEHLGQLAEGVKSAGASLGCVCDPDCDRLAFVDETGRAIGEEYTLAMATAAVLEQKNGPVVANISTSRMVDDIAREHSVPVYRTPVGEINVVAKMLEVSAVIGGEGNGGVILPEVHMGRDACTAAALVVGWMAARGAKNIGELTSSFGRYAMVKRKIAHEGADRDAMARVMCEAFPDGELDSTDGPKIIWPASWVHVRPSGTEPVVRIIAEAGNESEALRLVDLATAALSAA
jgi:phosphomannomutase